MPDENPLFLGGRVGAHTGAFLEWTANPAGNWQLMNSFDFDGFKAGVNLFNAGFGWTSGLEISSAFGQHGGLHGGKNISAQEANIGAGHQGLDIWASNDLVTGAIVLVTAGGNALNANNFLPTLLPGVRIVATPEVAGWGLTAGVGYIKGKKSVAATGTGATTNMVAADNLFVDFGAQGEVGDTSISFQADYATAKGVTTAAAGALAVTDLMGMAVDQKRTGYSARAYVEPMHGVIFSAGYGSQKLTSVLTPGVSSKTTWTHVGASYAVYQNFEIALTHQIQKITNVALTVGNTTKTTTTMLQLEAVM
jgi:hypothetical protein